MEFFRTIRDDFRARRNLEFYFTLPVAAIVIILGLLGGISEGLTASVTLAILTLVAYSLLQNRRENEHILKVIATTERLDDRVDELTRHLGRTFDFIRTDFGSNREAKRTVRSLIDQATREVLILDYNPVPQVNKMLRNSPDDILSDDRRNYYDILIEKAARSKPGQFRYKRILQLPDGYNVADVLNGDTILRLHCHELIQVGAKNPEVASLKACPDVHQGSFFLIDGRHLIVDLNILDPEHHYYVGGGYFFFEDPTGELIQTFRSFFERADNHAVPVRPTDLTKEA